MGDKKKGLGDKAPGLGGNSHKVSEMRFVFAGELPGKERPRFNSKTRRTYTAPKTAKAEQIIRKTALESYRAGPFKGAVKVVLEVGVPVPKSWVCAKRLQALAGHLHPTGRPDVDNVSKLVLDALNGILWKDDAQVCELRVKRVYMAAPETVLTVDLLGEDA